MKVKLWFLYWGLVTPRVTIQSLVNAALVRKHNDEHNKRLKENRIKKTHLKSKCCEVFPVWPTEHFRNSVSTVVLKRHQWHYHNSICVILITSIWSLPAANSTPELHPKPKGFQSLSRPSMISSEDWLSNSVGLSFTSFHVKHHLKAKAKAERKHPIPHWCSMLHNWKHTDTGDVTNGTTKQLRPCNRDLTAINSDSVHSPTPSIDSNTEWQQGLSSNTTVLAHGLHKGWIWNSLKQNNAKIIWTLFWRRRGLRERISD